MPPLTLKDCEGLAQGPKVTGERARKARVPDLGTAHVQVDARDLTQRTGAHVHTIPRMQLQEEEWEGERDREGEREREEKQRVAGRLGEAESSRRSVRGASHK